MRKLAILGVVVLALGTAAWFITDVRRAEHASPPSEIQAAAIPSNPFFPAHFPEDETVLCVGRVPIYDEGETEYVWAFLVRSDTEPDIVVRTDHE